MPESELLGPFPRPRRHAPVNGCPCPLSRSFFAEFSSPGTCILSDAALALRPPPTRGLALPWGVAAPWDGGGAKAGAAGDSNSVSSGSRSSGHLSEEPAGGKMTKTSGPIYHLHVVLSELPGPLGFEELPSLPPHRTNRTKCLSTRPGLALLLPIKGLPAVGADLRWLLGCGGSGENGIIKMGEQRRQAKFKSE